MPEPLVMPPVSILPPTDAPTATAVRFMDIPMFGRCRFPLWQGDEPLESKFYCGVPCDAAEVYCPECKAKTVGRGTPSERDAIKLPSERRRAA